MQAIIMAAGKGSRLGNLTQDIPKSFLEIRGIKLIEYNIALLHSFGIQDIIIVTGYQNEKMEEFAEKIEGIRCVYNPFYEMVNVLGSFYLAQDYLTEDTIYMHADTLCAPEIFQAMLQTKGDMVLPVEFKICDEEAMKIRLENERLAEISKQIPGDRGQGEFIGITKISRSILDDLKKASKKVLKEKHFQSYFEGAIQELINLQRYELKVIPTGDVFWTEIDFMADYERATARIPEELVAIAEKEFKV
ncbi:MAG: phosphocholine cytidylyltransferase family protein [Lachnospiraceae bacterium]|nr:phosphocholine cytidylyltransferase family protein [Lachnospiraceae bacterium]